MSCMFWCAILFKRFRVKKTAVIYCHKKYYVLLKVSRSNQSRFSFRGLCVGVPRAGVHPARMRDQPRDQLHTPGAQKIQQKHKTRTGIDIYCPEAGRDRVTHLPSIFSLWGCSPLLSRCCRGDITNFHNSTTQGPGQPGCQITLNPY